MAEIPYIFLDVDGVLNRFSPDGDDYCFCMETELVYGLQEILFAVDGAPDEGLPETRIVVSSAWRYAGIGEGSDIWKHLHIAGGPLGPLLASRLHDRTRVQPGEHESRSGQIAEYVEKHECKRWIAIDDDSDILKLPEGHRVLTNPYEGLSREKVSEAIRKLLAQS